MNNKGFSLVEIITVIAIMSIIVVIAFPVSNTIINNINKRSFAFEQEHILTVSKEYALTKKELFETTYKRQITVGELLDLDYLEADEVCKEGKECLCNEGETKCILDNNKSSINESKIVIVYLNNSFTSYWSDEESDETSELLVNKVCNNLKILNERNNTINNCTCESMLNNKCQYRAVDVNNYLFYENSLWRIVGVYNENGVKRVKVIMNNNLQTSSSLSYANTISQLSTKYTSLGAYKNFFVQKDIELISINEYNDSLLNTNNGMSTYLFNGSEMFLGTSEDNSYLSSMGNIESSNSRTSYGRLFLTVKEDVEALGNGTYANPYTFVNKRTFLITGVDEVKTTGATSAIAFEEDNDGYKLSSDADNYVLNSYECLDGRAQIQYNNSDKTIKRINDDGTVAECTVKLKKIYDITLRINNGKWQSNSSTQKSVSVQNGSMSSNAYTINSGYSWTNSTVNCDNTRVTVNNSTSNTLKVTPKDLVNTNSASCTLNLSKLYSVDIYYNNGVKHSTIQLVNNSTSSSLNIVQQSGYLLSGTTVSCTNGYTTSKSGNTFTVKSPSSTTSGSRCTINETVKNYATVTVTLTGGKYGGSTSFTKTINKNSNTGPLRITNTGNYYDEVSSSSCSSGISSSFSSGYLTISNSSSISDTATCNITFKMKNSITYKVYAGILIASGTATLKQNDSTTASYTVPSEYIDEIDTSRSYCSPKTPTYSASNGRLTITNNITGNTSCNIYLKENPAIYLVVYPYNSRVLSYDGVLERDYRNNGYGEGLRFNLKTYPDLWFCFNRGGCPTFTICPPRSTSPNSSGCHTLTGGSSRYKVEGQYEFRLVGAYENAMSIWWSVEPDYWQQDSVVFVVIEDDVAYCPALGFPYGSLAACG